MALPNGFKLAPGEHIVQCPYERAHQVTNSRLLVHLTKCRNYYIKVRKEQGLSVEYVECKFNFLHKVLKPELDQHHATCPNQSNVVKFVQYRTSGGYQRKPSGIKQSQSPEKKPMIVENRRDEQESNHANSYSNNSEQECYPIEHTDYNGKVTNEQDTRTDDYDSEYTYEDYRRNNEPRSGYKEPEQDYGYRREDGESGKDSEYYYEETEEADAGDYYEENWDEDWDAAEPKEGGCQTGYDPSVKLKNAAVMYHPMGLTKSERKAFHLSKAIKFQADYKPAPSLVGNRSNLMNPNHPSYQGNKPAKRAKREP